MFLSLVASGETIATIKIELDELLDGFTLKGSAPGVSPADIDALDDEATFEMDTNAMEFTSHNGQRAYVWLVTEIEPWMQQDILAA